MSNCVTDDFRAGALRAILMSGPKVALYTRQARFDKTLTRYTPENEVRAPGYQAGGQAISGGEVLATEDGFVLVMHSPVWNNATITARCAVLYLSEDNNRAVRVMDFGQDVSSTNDVFRVKFPGAADGGVLSL